MASIKSLNRDITHRLTTLENTLKRKLLAIYNSKIKNSTLPAESLRQKLDNEVRTIIRKAVEDSYLIGTDIVGKQINVKVPEFQIFISVNDVQNIQQITNKMDTQFWKTVNRLVQRDNEFIVKGGELEKKNPFDEKAAMIGVSAYVAFSAFNTAVQSKTNLVNSVPASQFDFDIEFDISQLADFQGKVMFLTAEDARVDPEICMPLDRLVYDANDPDIPIPPLHNHCRCRLLPLLEGTEI